MCVRTAFAMAAMIGIAFNVASASAREVVPFDGRVSPGTVPAMFLSAGCSTG